jgi:hypothetical protein
MWLLNITCLTFIISKSVRQMIWNKKPSFFSSAPPFLYKQIFSRRPPLLQPFLGSLWFIIGRHYKNITSQAFLWTFPWSKYANETSFWDFFFLHNPQKKIKIGFLFLFLVFFLLHNLKIVKGSMNNSTDIMEILQENMVIR